ncbi:MAG TPA: 23S rRNA (pseudouridine(1915)-N(3))-methyltransferase RlmH [Blastocatellia bacterium]|nr:23S rRNA (pseudouridine(1915)-N(3))-methyltransferase RlmH [Blastocatellia bacterium]
MKLRFVWVGKTRRAPVRELVEEYVGRLRHFAPVEITELRDRSEGSARQIIEREGEDILARLTDAGFVVVLDERGREMDSFKLAEFVEQHRAGGTKQMTFVIGGHQGLAEAVRRRAGLVLALSRMTLTHEFARVLLTEQVYRAFTIIHDLPYQK